MSTLSVLVVIVVCCGKDVAKTKLITFIVTR